MKQPLAAAIVGITWVLAVTLGACSPTACTVLVRPGESIQAAIDQAPEGAVICVGAGVWEENLRLERELTLVGAGCEETVIKGAGLNQPAILVQGGEQVVVRIEGLTVARAKGWQGGHGIRMTGRVQVDICDVVIREVQDDGIQVEDMARATIRDCTVCGSGWAGLSLWGGPRSPSVAPPARATLGRASPCVTRPGRP
ncbi:MAG: hypothetical protein ACP5G2_05065 [Candidatus Bipolaricaulaceae bacterium]